MHPGHTPLSFVLALAAGLLAAAPTAAQEVRYGPPAVLASLPPVESMDPELPFLTLDLELPEGHGTPYHTPGPYPSAYRVYVDPETAEHRIALVGFVPKE